MWPAASQMKPVPDWAAPFSPSDLRGVERAGARADDLHDGRRGALEQLDRRAFDVGERAARLDRARGRGRKQQPVEIGLRDVDAHDDQQRNNHDLRQTVAHRRPLHASLLRALERVVDHAREGDGGASFAAHFASRSASGLAATTSGFALALVDQFLDALARGHQHRVEFGNVRLLRQRAVADHDLGAVVGGLEIGVVARAIMPRMSPPLAKSMV